MTRILPPNSLFSSKTLLFTSIGLPKADAVNGYIRCLDVCRASSDSNHFQFVTLGDDKTLRLWQFDSSSSQQSSTTAGVAKRLKQVTFKKRLTCCVFIDAETVLVGDKFGDGYVARLDKFDDKSTQEPQFGTMSSITSMVRGTRSFLQFGFFYVMFNRRLFVCLFVTVVRYEQIPLQRHSLFAVAERDEKITVYRFPNVFEIESFCLGHTEYAGEKT
jgi:hypothetical protein